jgi:hypothetical protein
LNVAILYTDTLKPVNGTSERVVQIATALSDQGVHVTLSGFVEKNSKSLNKKNLKIIELPASKFDFFGVCNWFARLIADVLVKRKYDIIQIECFPFLSTLLIVLFFHPLAKKIIIVFHDKRFKDDPRKSIQGSFQLIIQRTLLILCDIAITPGLSVKKYFTDLHGKIADTKIIVIPNGVPNSISEQCNNCLNLPPKSFKVLFFGSMKFKPNYDDALRLYEISKLIGAKFKEITKTDILFLIAGRGSEILPKSDMFLPCGFVEHLNDIFFLSDVIILPHSPSYSGPHVKTLYAFLSGKPVVATRDAVKDLLDIEENKHFLLFDLDDNGRLLRTLVQLFFDEDARLNLATNSLSYVKNFSWNGISSLHIKTYERLLFGNTAKV